MSTWKLLAVCAVGVVVFGSNARADGTRGEIQLDASVSPGGSRTSSETRIAAGKDRVYACWIEQGDLSTDVYFAWSGDGGKSWATEVRLDTDDASDDNEPFIAADGDLVCVAWLELTAGDGEDVLARVSTDGGVSFGPVLDISRTLKDDGYDTDLMRVTVSGSYVHIVFEDEVNTFGGNEDVFVASSQDSGANFSVPVPVNEDPPTDIDDPDVGANGKLGYVTWIDERVAPGAPWMSITTDGGVTWGANFKVSRAPPGVDADATRIAVDGNTIAVAWQDNRSGGGQGPVYVAVSVDGGQTFGFERRAGTSSVDAGEIEVAVAGQKVYAAWSDSRNGALDVFVAVSTDGGLSYTEVGMDQDGGTVATINPEIVAQGDSIYVSYQDETDVAGEDVMWLAVSSKCGASGTYLRQRASDGLPVGFDTDTNRIAVTEHRDVVVIWIDDRACGDNPCNDVYVNGQRFPNLIFDMVGPKHRFQLADASLGDNGLFFFAVFSQTGTARTPLPGGMSMCLTVDGTTVLMAQNWAVPFFGDIVTDCKASTVPVYLPFPGWCVGLVFDLNTLEVVATTDPVAF